MDKKDKVIVKKYPFVKKGLFSEDYSIYEEINSCVAEYDENRFLNHINKIELIKGDANKTIPLYLKKINTCSFLYYLWILIFISQQAQP